VVAASIAALTGRHLNSSIVAQDQLGLSVAFLDGSRSKFVRVSGLPARYPYQQQMNEAVEPCGARFFDKGRQDLGRAVRVAARKRSGLTLTVLDVTGAEPALARALVLFDRGRLRIHCEDVARTCYVFRWASGYSNGSDVRIQGVLEPTTGHELEGWIARAEPAPRPKPDSPPVASWALGRPGRRW